MARLACGRGKDGKVVALLLHINFLHWFLPGTPPLIAHKQDLSPSYLALLYYPFILGKLVLIYLVGWFRLGLDYSVAISYKLYFFIPQATQVV